MHQFNALFGQHDQLHQLAQHARANALINELWQSSAPDLASCSSALHLKDGVLTVSVINASVATKIKLTQASLLKALENSQKKIAEFKLCKVTLIKVKVQVKSTPKTRPKRPIKLSSSGAQQLNQYADSIAGTPLGDILKKLASKSTS
ncbi:MAG: DciA family protein [Methylophilus sp.]|nr:DciA family protein [Methylophilus sp.]